MNMLSLYFFGPWIELSYGGMQFLGIYFAAIVGGNLLSLLVHRHDDYRAYGASGGVAGIILAHIFMFPGGSVQFFLVPVPIPSWLYAIAFLGASFYGMKNQIGNVGHDAHLGGALVGLYTAAGMHPFIVRESPRLFAVISVGTILLLVYLGRESLLAGAGGIRFPRFGNSGKAASRSDLPDHKQTEREWDAILAKVSERGIHSLTPEEEAVLRQTSAKYKRRAEPEKPKSGLAL